jgi:hypothetical protein
MGLLAFLLSICLNVYEEPFDKAIFEEEFNAVNMTNASKVANLSEGGPDKEGLEMQTSKPEGAKDSDEK